MIAAAPRPRVVLPGQATHGRQSWDYESTWRIAYQVVRVTIRRDAYDFQSHLAVDAWDPRRRAWNSLLKRLIAGFRIALVSSYREEPPLPAFHADEQRLLREAGAILAAARRRP